MKEKKKSGKKQSNLTKDELIATVPVMSDKLLEEDEWRSDIPALFAGTRIKFYYLRKTLLCNMFVVNNPKLDIDFPVHGSEDNTISTMGGYLDTPENVFELFNKNHTESNKLTRNEKEYLLTLKEKAYNLLYDLYFGFNAINIGDKESFLTINKYCIIIDYVLEIAYRDVKNTPFTGMIGAILDKVFCLSLDLTQKYFELIGYWTRRAEEKTARKDSGKGQKDAREERVQKLAEAIKTFADDNAGVLLLNKTHFINMLSATFVGAEKTPRHHNTIHDYVAAVEAKLNKQIILTKGR